ncbi:MAG: DUF4913 domain-containing protein [Frankiaceae bacterium]
MSDVEELQQWIARVEQALADLQETVTDAVATSGGGLPTPPPARPPLAFDNVEEFVTGMFAPRFARSIGGPVKWCPQWWDHPEAVLRLEALWRSWEAHRLDPDRGIAVWLRDFADPQLTALLHDTGTFAACNPDKHSPRAPLPLAAAPAGYWDQQ